MGSKAIMGKDKTVTAKLKQQTLRKLKVIAAIEQRTMMDLFDELVNNRLSEVSVSDIEPGVCVSD